MDDLTTVAPSAEEILVAAAALVERHVQDAGLRDSLRGLLVEFGTAMFTFTPPRVPLPMQLPAIIHAAVTGDSRPATPVCGAALLLFLGIDILDDLMDGDVTSYWQGATPAETLLVATTLVSALPQAALAALDAPASTRLAMQQALADGLLAMAGGQRIDILNTGQTDATPEEVLASVAGKSGAFTGMLARLGALLAGASEECVAEYAAWGANFGMADQLSTDCADLFIEPPGNDFRRGIFSFPLACLMEEASAGTEKRRTELTIRSAGDDQFSRFCIRGALAERGVIAIIDQNIQWHHFQAQATLDRAAPLEPAGMGLRALTARVPRLGIQPRRIAIEE